MTRLAQTREDTPWQVLIEAELHADSARGEINVLRGQLRSVMERLMDILELDEREIGLDLLDRQAGSKQLQQLLDREPVTANTDLTSEFAWLDG